MSSSTTNGRGTEGATGIAVARAAVGIISVRTCRALEDVGAVEVLPPLVRAVELVLVLVDGKMGGVVLVLGGNSSTDGRRMVGGLRVGAEERQGRGLLYDGMHRLTGGDAITAVMIRFCRSYLQ